MTRLRILVLPPGPPPDLVAAVREAVGPDPELVVPAPDTDRPGLHRLLRTADAVLGDWSGRFPLGPDEAGAAERVRLVQQPGVGVEYIDLAAWSERGIPVSNAHGSNAVAVAEWCVAAVLALLRQLVWADARVRSGEWPPSATAVTWSRELCDQRVGLVGFGPIGVACARLLAPFGCPVGYWSRRRRSREEELGATYRELDDLLATSDVLIIAVALAPGTRGLLDARRLALLPDRAVVVNAARGAVVVEEALAAALADGHLAGAGLDVFATEPLPADSPLRTAPNILFSPHVAGGTRAARARAFVTAAENLACALRGEPVRFVLNGV
jgi:D-3-phosphoglycerate dehydrogenase